MPETENTVPDAAPPLPALTRAGDNATRAQNDWSADRAALAPIPEGPVMGEALFEVSPDDLNAAQSYLMNPRSRGGIGQWLWLALPVLAVGIPLGLTIASGRRPFPRPSGGATSPLVGALLPALVAILLVAIFSLIVLRYLLRRNMEKAQKAAQSKLCRIWFTEDYLGVRDALAENRNLWASVSAIDEGKKHWFVRFHNGNALPVPKRAFGSEAEGHAFYDEMTRLWRARSGG